MLDTFSTDIYASGFMYLNFVNAFDTHWAVVYGSRFMYTSLWSEVYGTESFVSLLWQYVSLWAAVYDANIVYSSLWSDVFGTKRFVSLLWRYASFYGMDIMLWLCSPSLSAMYLLDDQWLVMY